MADRPVVNAIRGKARKAQYDDVIEYDTNGPSKAKENDAPANYIFDENDAAIKARREARQSREVAVAKPDKTKRMDPVAATRGVVSDAIDAVRKRFSK